MALTALDRAQALHRRRHLLDHGVGLRPGRAVGCRIVDGFGQALAMFADAFLDRLAQVPPQVYLSATCVASGQTVRTASA
ncbi:hypothetical protein SSP24_74760 [Streptomyces spinoverrucosus]|uniref:Uncharacterized protein n=1 Tax=Streptomyces spinoverrucosus TaxID=284043 RepID=A0A4Y3VVR3_9ACTN|nr:hypothetical protein SSP24_74760 [Streptomyces spinoverrucosus]GHB96985.1 hypothetical protein GCM10010397_81950 [Streptomyces spinoverrucosus]